MQKKIFLSLVSLVLFVFLTAQTCTFTPINSTCYGDCAEGYECEEGVCIYEGHLSVAAIKLHYSDFTLSNLQEKIDVLLTEHPDVDLIVTPEYLFVGWGSLSTDYNNDPIIIQCNHDGTSCTVESTGTELSDEIILAVETMQEVARDNSVNIVLGTVAEQITVNDNIFTVDTQLIINNTGDIIGKHTKYDYVYSAEFSCSAESSLCEEVMALNLETAKSFMMTTRNGNSFEILPIICGEKAALNYIEAVSETNASLIVISDFDIDFDYDNLTASIQGGENPFEDAAQFSGEWLLYNIFNTMLEYGVIIQDSYFIASDGYQPTAGIISWNFNEIEALDDTDAYVYGKIPLE